MRHYDSWHYDSAMVQTLGSQLRCADGSGYPTNNRLVLHRECPLGPAAASGRGNIQPWERTEARMGARLLGRATLSQLVVVAIICGFVSKNG